MPLFPLCVIHDLIVLLHFLLIGCFFYMFFRAYLCFASRIFFSYVNNGLAQFIVPDWGDKFNSGIGLSYLPARLRIVQRLALAVQNDNPMPESTIYSPVRDYEFGYKVSTVLFVNYRTRCHLLLCIYRHCTVVHVQKESY
jgi:hypothetical protein